MEMGITQLAFPYKRGVGCWGTSGGLVPPPAPATIPFSFTFCKVHLSAFL